MSPRPFLSLSLSCVILAHFIWFKHIKKSHLKFIDLTSFVFYRISELTLNWLCEYKFHCNWFQKRINLEIPMNTTKYVLITKFLINKSIQTFSKQFDIISKFHSCGCVCACVMNIDEDTFSDWLNIIMIAKKLTVTTCSFHLTYSIRMSSR